MKNALLKFNTFFLALLVVVTVGCASVDYDYPREESFSPDTSKTQNTYFGRYSATELPKHPAGMSGFMLLGDGVEAFAARLMMADWAQQTLDAQYYLLTDDVIGYAFIASLLKAADRGVRVRLLLDDMLTQGYDLGMVALDSHPNIELRVFNPFTSRTFRPFDLPKFSRLNRRMHNKSFTVDNQLTLIGGRNIAGEYFGARADLNFGDLDVVALGPVVEDVSVMFDEYWNSSGALPVPAFAKSSKQSSSELEIFRARVKEKIDAAVAGVYVDALGEDYMRLLMEESDRIEWANYKLIYDAPSKAILGEDSVKPYIIEDIESAIRQGEKELILVSPYFVPLKAGEAFFQELVDRGMDVIIVTNSLAANNHGAVHSGYAPSRNRLLEMGVRLYEVKSQGISQEYERVGHENSRATLHTKAFLVDRSKLFIGSFNWDPRSININTEMGVLIDSPELGKVATRNFDLKLDEKTYEVVLNDKGQLRWIDRSGDNELVLNKEPDTSWWKRFTTGFMGILPIKSQL
ncbi:Phosphatidylserine/phosphatidylglycerophosphate/cardiolipin synthase [Alteromonadaceae bacterium Bs31]|nr:Phosphatidylserine/phosphatidylglycerophosphate/cardiolipin synthase [Alteromonadaceae bacterium Bs31]